MASYSTRPASTESRRLSEASKAAVFSAMLLTLALAAALLIRVLDPHAAWHLPLILLTSLHHSDGNLLIILPQHPPA